MPQLPPPQPSFKTVMLRLVDDGIPAVIAVLFWSLVILILTIAVASSPKPWDTVIAGMAMLSQSFFGYVVWRLGKAQYQSTNRTAERQHKIDMYPLRTVAAQSLKQASAKLKNPRSISFAEVEAFRQCHLDTQRLFSLEAERLAFSLYETVEEARSLYSKSFPKYHPDRDEMVAGDFRMEIAGEKAIEDAYDILTDLENAMSEEMRIR